MWPDANRSTMATRLTAPSFDRDSKRSAPSSCPLLCLHNKCHPCSCGTPHIAATDAHGWPRIIAGWPRLQSNLGHHAKHGLVFILRATWTGRFNTEHSVIQGWKPDTTSAGAGQGPGKKNSVQSGLKGRQKRTSEQFVPALRA